MPSSGFVLHQEDRRIGDVDRAVIGLHAPLVALAVGKRLLLEHDRPALRRLLEHIRVVGEHVRSPLEGNAVMHAIDGVPGRILEPIVDRLPARDQVDIDGLDLLAGDQAERRIARGGDQIEPALVHQRHHLVGGCRRLDVDLAARLLLEGGHPIVVLVGLAALDVTGPGNDIDFAFALADGFRRFGERDAASGKQGNDSD